VRTTGETIGEHHPGNRNILSSNARVDTELQEPQEPQDPEIPTGLDPSNDEEVSDALVNGCRTLGQSTFVIL
jgi:hypothetical protein